MRTSRGSSRLLNSSLDFVPATELKRHVKVRRVSTSRIRDPTFFISFSICFSTEGLLELLCAANSSASDLYSNLAGFRREFDSPEAGPLNQQVTQATRDTCILEDEVIRCRTLRHYLNEWRLFGSV